MCCEQLLASRQPWVVTWCMVSYCPFVAEEDLAVGANHMAPKTNAWPAGLSVGCTPPSASPYVLQGAWCYSQSLSSRFCFFASGHEMLLLEKPPDRLHPSWSLCAVTATQHPPFTSRCFNGQKHSKGHLFMGPPLVTMKLLLSDSIRWTREFRTFSPWTLFILLRTHFAVRICVGIMGPNERLSLQCTSSQ